VGTGGVIVIIKIHHRTLSAKLGRGNIDWPWVNQTAMPAGLIHKRGSNMLYRTCHIQF